MKNLGISLSATGSPSFTNKKFFSPYNFRFSGGNLCSTSVSLACFYLGELVNRRSRYIRGKRIEFGLPSNKEWVILTWNFASYFLVIF